MKTKNYILIILIVLGFGIQSPIKTVEMSLGGNSTIENTEDEKCFGCGDCSVYCAIENEFSVKSSSHLKSQGNNTYTASNLNDYNLQTAWIEGVEGTGSGEWIEYIFKEQNFANSTIKISGIYLYNGYRKNQNSWNENSRIKKLKISINGEDLLIAKLHNSVNQQSLEFKEIELRNIKNIRFTIMETYKGNRYSDTSISELKLVGIHHH